MTDPTDDTDRHPIVDPPAPAAPRSPVADADPGAGAGSTPAQSPDARIEPATPPDSGWREPAWFPPRDRDRDRRPSAVAVVVGLVLIAIGVWFFVDRTLGLAMPRIQWSSVWPIILIVIGGLVILRSFQRKA